MTADGAPTDRDDAGWLQAFADAQPATLVADAVRSLTGIGGASAWPAVAWSPGLLTVLGPVAVRLFGRARARVPDQYG